jgi:NAD+ kinase
LNDRILCRKSSRCVHMLRLHPNGLFNVLRSKLSWGER